MVSEEFRRDGGPSERWRPEGKVSVGGVSVVQESLQINLYSEGTSLKVTGG